MKPAGEFLPCTNISSLWFNSSQQDFSWFPELASCLFWNMVQNELLLNICILLILVLFTFSLVVNSYLLLGLEHSEALSWNPRYMLLKNLIVSDLLQTLTIAPSSLYCLLCHKTLSFGPGCLAQFFIAALAIITSLLTVASMALERYVFTCQGIHYLVVMTSKRICFFVTLIWLLALIGAGTSTVLVLVGRAKFGQVIAGFVCEPEVVQAQLLEPVYFETFNKAFIGSLLCFCLLIFSFSYGRMYQEAKQMQQPFQQDNIRARSTIFFYFIIFLLQLFPSIIKFITMCGKDVDNQLYMLLIVLVPPCVNPVAYGIKNVEVRQALERMCGLKKLKELVSK